MKNTEPAHLLDRLRSVLIAAQAQRPELEDGVPALNGDELPWVVHERSVMHAEVNAIRAEHGWEPVSLDAVVQAELLACCHQSPSEGTGRFSGRGNRFPRLW